MQIDDASKIFFHVFDSNIIVPLKIMDFENVFNKNNSLLCDKSMGA
jgi:hypothetical protein